MSMDNKDNQMIAQEQAYTASSPVVQSVTNIHDPTVPVSSTVSTPGPDFPGAFPGGNVQDSYSTNSAKDTAFKVLESAKSYIPAQKDVEIAMLSASQTVKQYLPNGVASYFTTSKSTIIDDPSHAETFMHEAKEPQKVNGDGLSRCYEDTAERASTEINFQNDNHKDTVKPPEERSFISNGLSNSTPSALNPQSIDMTTLTPHTDPLSRGGSENSSNISTQAQDGSETTISSARDTPMGAIAGSNITNSFPQEHSASEDTISSNRTLDLPHQTEEHLSKQHEETASDKEPPTEIHPQGLNLTPRTHPLAAEGAKWKGVPLGESYQAALDANPDRQLNLGTGKGNVSALETGYKEKAGDEMKDEILAVKDKVLNVTTEHSPEPTRPPHPDSNVDSTTADVGHSPVGHKQDGSTVSNVSYKDSSTFDGSKAKNQTQGTNKGNGTEGGSPHKSRFMDKIKGEMKVISGKLAHNDEKVEEGKRLMGKGV